MGICATWVEGETLAIEMMQKREKTTVKPKRMECTMRLGSTWGELNYMKGPEGYYKEMWLLWFDCNGLEYKQATHTSVSDARSEGYELMRLGKLAYRTR